MNRVRTDFGERAFGKASQASVTVKYESQQHALDFLWSILGDSRAVGMVEGPEGSGKSTVLRQFASELPRDASVALVDGTGFKPRGFVAEILARYGYTTDLQTTDELLQLLGMFAAQQTRSYQAPILMVDNADRMLPSTLETLARMAALSEQGKPALRIILTGRQRLRVLADRDGNPGAQRPIDARGLEPMSVNEALIYLHARLEACGVGTPDSIFPGDVCDKLHEVSKGWPGRLNALALTAIKGSETFPVSVARLTKRPQKLRDRKAPSLLISKDGKLLREYVINERKVIIGRSDFADIVIEDQFCSKFHVLLLLYSDGLVMLDLNSVNGTTVNSVRVKSTLLLDNDIISLGDHRLKVRNAPAVDAGMAGRTTVADTARMKTLDDLRRKRRALLRAVPGGAGKKA